MDQLNLEAQPRQISAGISERMGLVQWYLGISCILDIFRIQHLPFHCRLAGWCILLAVRWFGFLWYEHFGPNSQGYVLGFFFWI